MEDRPQSAIEQALRKQEHSDPEVHRRIQQYISETISQLGGIENCQVGDLAMLIIQKMNLTFALTIEAEIVRRGSLLDEKGKPNVLLATLRSVQAEFRAGQVALGLCRSRITSRKANARTGAIADIIEEYRERKADMDKAAKKAH